MSDEYRIQFSHDDPAAVACSVGRLTGAVAQAEDALEVALRSDANPSTMPDALLRAEPYGAYFCVFGGNGRAFLGSVIARLVSEYGELTVGLLE